MCTCEKRITQSGVFWKLMCIEKKIYLCLVKTFLLKNEFREVGISTFNIRSDIVFSLHAERIFGWIMCCCIGSYARLGRIRTITELYIYHNDLSVIYRVSLIITLISLIRRDKEFSHFLTCYNYFLFDRTIRNFFSVYFFRISLSSLSLYRIIFFFFRVSNRFDDLFDLSRVFDDNAQRRRKFRPLYY